MIHSFFLVAIKREPKFLKHSVDRAQI